LIFFATRRLNYTVHKLIAIHCVYKMSIYFFVLPFAIFLAPFAIRHFLESGFITKKVVQVSWSFQMIHLESEQDMCLSIKNKMILFRVVKISINQGFFLWAIRFNIKTERSWWTLDDKISLNIYRQKSRRRWKENEEMDDNMRGINLM
jgi:hypothetical protein